MYNEREIRNQLIAEGARAMMVAARTAPKTKGMDTLEVVMLCGAEEIRRLSEAMRLRATQTGMHFLERDAVSILHAGAIILIGAHRMEHNLNCSYCGAPSCALKPEAAPCAFNSIDLGIATGSACATAADKRLDTRVMFSAGWCAMGLGLLQNCTQALAIAVGIDSKNPFFDRK